MIGKLKYYAALLWTLGCFGVACGSMAILCTGPCHTKLAEALQDKIQKSMSKDMVEPKRKYIDVESTWKKQLLNKAAGPGGLLMVTIVQARDLRCFLNTAVE